MTFEDWFKSYTDREPGRDRYLGWFDTMMRIAYEAGQKSNTEVVIDAIGAGKKN